MSPATAPSDDAAAGRRASRARSAGLARAEYLAHRLATALRERRRELGLSQREVGARTGFSQREISRLESGKASSAGIDTWAACGAVLDMQLAAFFEQMPGADQPRDMEHLRRQDLVIRASAPGGWQAEPESAIPGAGPLPRSIDVLLTRPLRREAAVVEIWDLLTDGGAAMRGLDVKVLAVRDRLGHDWRVQGLLVVRGTSRNRRLVRELRALFAARYRGSSSVWLRCLADPDARMPEADGFAWTDVRGARLLVARLHR